MKKLTIILTFLIILMISFNSYAAQDDNPFTDIQEGSNYYKEVLWAVNTDPQIVQGITKDKFKPFTTCNRAQMVTFLWRMKGCPEPETTKNPFKDVKTTDFFYKPVLWASENSITSGKAKDKFAPLDSCTRAQFVTFLWRMEDEPEVRSDENPFVDVSSDAMYTPAVLWASRYKITSGKDSTHFAPNKVINRAQTVMFLYRLNQYVQGEFDEATLEIYAADSVADIIRVIYSPGDYADSVINDLTLNTTFDDVNVTWSSSDTSVISNTGKVTRPDDANKTVTLTATVKVNDAVAKRTFVVNVIRNKVRNTDDIPEFTVDDIRELNKDDPNFFIEYSDTVIETITDEKGNNTFICPLSAICGKFSDIIIECPDDALAALYSIKGLLKINHPSSELSVGCVNHSKYGVSYTFKQYYDGMEVYGRSITVSSDANGIVSSVSSSCFSLDDSTDLSPIVSIDEALGIVNNLYEADSVTAKYDRTVIYNLDEYEENPVPVYLFDVEISSSTHETVLLDAKDGAVICKSDNSNSITVKAKTESNKDVDIPLSILQPFSDLFNKDFYYIKDTQKNIIVTKSESVILATDTDYTLDPTYASVYNNFQKIYEWYKDNLNRNSIDNNFKEIHLSTHTINKVNNASWNGYTERFYFYNNGKDETKDFSNLPTTPADSLDVCAHEYTHAVVKYTTDTSFTTLHTRDYITSAINEAYADIFAWFIDNDDNTINEDWLRPDKYQENKKYVRDLSNPGYSNYPSKMYDSNWYKYEETDPNAGSYYSHYNSTVISHAAYLMSQGFGNTQYPKITMDKLINLWYESLSKGYDSNSDFFTVRKHVLMAARNNGLSSSEIETVKKAFDEVGINRKVYISRDYTDYLENYLMPKEGIYDPSQKVYMLPPDVFAVHYVYRNYYKDLVGYYDFIDSSDTEYNDERREYFTENNADLSGIYYYETGDYDNDGKLDMLVIMSDESIPMSSDDILQKYKVKVCIYTTILGFVVFKKSITLDQADYIYISNFIGKSGKYDKRCLTIVNTDNINRLTKKDFPYKESSDVEITETGRVISLDDLSEYKTYSYTGTYNENFMKECLADEYSEPYDIIFRYYGGVVNSFQKEYADKLFK